MFRRGFTVIELVLCTLIVSLLIALLLPGLAGLRIAASRLETLERIAGAGRAFLVYANDYHDSLPYFTDPKAQTTILWIDETPVPIKYFHAHAFWPVVMGSTYFGDRFSAAMYPAGMDRGLVSTFNYSCVFQADPDFWDSERRMGPGQWRAVRQDEVVFSSAKGLLTNRTPSDIPDVPRETVFIDGRAAANRPADFTNSYPRGDGHWEGCFHHTGSPVLHTISGARGRDIR